MPRSVSEAQATTVATDIVPAGILDDPGFCRYSTGRIAVFEGGPGRPWSEPSLEPYGALAMDPATLGLHYGQVVFEGLKAFRSADGSVALFRAADHGRRFELSAERLAMAGVPVDHFVRACSLLVSADHHWVPSGFGQSLYIRPLLFGSEADLGLKPPRSLRCVLLAYPADPCFGKDFRPLSVKVATDAVRAVRGGTGEAKCAGNYAASLLTRTQAQAAGYDEVLWLDGIERRWVEELSTMNLFFVWNDGSTEATGHSLRITTPPCTGTVVRGLTRDALLTLAGDLGLNAVEEPTSVDGIRDGLESGRLVEVFACGTAGAVVAVGRLGIGDKDFTVGDGHEGVTTARLRDALLAVQHGRTPDKHGWLLHVEGTEPAEGSHGDEGRGI